MASDLPPSQLGRIAGGLASGLIFGLGLALSGMTDPANVIGFLDVAGRWNPSLIFVMGGAVVTAFIGFRLVLRRGAPIVAAGFHLPKTGEVDVRLLGGAAIFGIGWGLSGYCPGPAIASLSQPSLGLLAFLAMSLIGSRLAAAFKAKPEDLILDSEAKA